MPETKHTPMCRESWIQMLKGHKAECYMHLARYPVECGLLSLMVLSLAVCQTTSTRDKQGVHAASRCQVTLPNGSQPPTDMLSGPQMHGNGKLWVALPADGILYVTKDPNGELGAKLPWWRGAHGKLVIEGHKIGVPEETFRSYVPGGYGDTGFQSTGVYFRSTGCWQIVGKIGSSELQFTEQVELLK